MNNYKDDEGRYVMSGGLKPWHERVVDYMILNPNAKIVTIATEFKVSPQWVGTLIKSDAFREYYSRRMDEHRGYIDNSVVSRLQEVAIKSLDKMSQCLDSSDVTFSAVKEAGELALKGLGYTGNGAGMSVNVNSKDGGAVTINVTSDAVARAREKLARHMADNTKQLEHDPKAYQNVTASLELGAEEIEDAVVVPDKE